MIKKLLKLIRRRYLPTMDDRMADKYRHDGGDYQFLFDFDLDKDSLVLDIGGYEGQWASDLFSRYQCKILIFEVVKSFVDNINERFKGNDYLNVYNHGLGGFTRKEKISVSEDSSSMYIDSDNYEEIEIEDFKEWMSKNNINSIQLIKMNIEGAEYELLERIIEIDFIKNIDNLLIQFHNFSSDSRSRMENIQEHLRKTHRLTFHYEFIWENWTKK